MTIAAEDKLTYMPSPIENVIGVLERKGLSVTGVDDAVSYVDFELPTLYGSVSPTVAEYIDQLGLLQITATLATGILQPVLLDGLHIMLNNFNVMFPVN